MTAKRKSPTRKGKGTRRKAEAERLAEFLREETKVTDSPDVLVPKTASQQVLEGIRDRLVLALKDPRKEILGRAERVVLESGKRLLQVNREYGLSLSGLVRSGARILWSVPKRPNRD